MFGDSQSVWVYFTPACFNKYKTNFNFNSKLKTITILTD